MPPRRPPVYVLSLLFAKLLNSNKMEFVNPDLVNIIVFLPFLTSEQWFRAHASFVADILDMPKAFARTSWKILMSILAN